MGKLWQRRLLRRRNAFFGVRCIITNLYNNRPQWLANTNRALDSAVAEAYGGGEDWLAGMADDKVLACLFALNQARA